MTDTKRPRVLAIAEAANPEWVSVPLVGWSLAAALREVADVHLVTQVRNRDAILRAGLVEGRDFTAIDSETFARPMWKLAERLRMGEGKGWTIVQAVNALSYPWFERLVWQQFGPAIQRGDYDIVHRITPLSPTSPSSLAAKCARAGVPFVLGPLNGGVPWPDGWDDVRHAEKEYLAPLRRAYRLLPDAGATLDHAAMILAGSRHTASDIPDRHQHKVLWLPENGIDPARFNRRATPQAGPLRACFIGRMVPYKGPDMLLDAAADLLRDGQMMLDMVGDGPMMPDLHAQADRPGIAENVIFHGWQAHEAVQDILCRAHLFAFPSIREFGGGVVLEAMALGVPPLIVDYAGPGELVDDSIGLKTPIGPRDRIIADFRAELTRLAADPAQLRPLADAAYTRIQDHFLWARKADQIRRAYDWMLNEATTDKPSLL